MQEKKLNKKKKKINFWGRMAIFLLIFIVTYFIGLNLFSSSLKLKEKEKLLFQETGNVSYSVCLTKNSFFDDNCLDANMAYVASLIKKIPLNFNYQFNGNIDNMVSSVDYEIVAKLVIKNSDTLTKYYEKEYVLVPKTNDSLGDNTLYNLKKQVDIDYDYYNNIATTFKSQYGVDADSYLDVYLNVYNNLNDYKELPTLGQIAVEIPLSKKAIEIKLNTQELNKKVEKTIVTKCFKINNGFKLLIGTIILLISSFFLWLVLTNITLHSKKISKYDKLINKILKEYDRLIVETSTSIDFNDYNIFVIESFNELVDVRDNLQLPIMFLNLKDQGLAQFYVLQDNNLYLYTIDKKKVNKAKKG